jgi:UPF0176 protein
LIFKNSKENSNVFVAKEPKVTAPKPIKIKKQYIEKGTHFFPRPNIAQFLI